MRIQVIISNLHNDLQKERDALLSYVNANLPHYLITNLHNDLQKERDALLACVFSGEVERSARVVDLNVNDSEHK